MELNASILRDTVRFHLLDLWTHVTGGHSWRDQADQPILIWYESEVGRRLEVISRDGDTKERYTRKDIEAYLPPPDDDWQLKVRPRNPEKQDDPAP